MDICASVYIFQAKVDELIGDIEGIKIYIDDILVLSKESFYNKIEQIMIIFGRLRSASLKFNAIKYSSEVKEIP